MEITQEVLEQAAELGTIEVSKALTKLVNAKIIARVSLVQEIPVAHVLTMLKPLTENTIVVYAQMLTGISGVAILTIPRTNALIFVDLLTQQPVGTTGILKDIDRSALKESLNILSNAYMTALSQLTKTEFSGGVPGMITSEQIDTVLTQVASGTNLPHSAYIFETVLEISQHKITIALFFVFSDEFSKIIGGGV